MSKKASTASTTSSSSASSTNALHESYLRNATEGQLVSRLLDVFSALEATALKETTTTTGASGAKDTNFSVVKACKGIISEVSKREYLTNPSADVQVAVACCLSCVIGGGTLAARGAPNPIPKDLLTDAQCSDVLKLIVNTIQRLQSESGKTSYHSYIRQLVEKLAGRHGIHSLISRLLQAGNSGNNKAASDADETCELLFSVLLGTSVEDDALIAQMGALICDVIEAHQSLTDTQLQQLLVALTSAAATANPSANTPRRVALNVLRRKEEVVASAVGGYIVHEVEGAVEEMIAADVAAVDDNSDEAAQSRKQALKRLGAILETSMAVCRVGASLSSGILPRLQQYLTTDNNDIRLIFTRTFSRIFMTTPAFAQTFTPAYHAFLGRFADPRVPIRTEMLKYAKDVLANAPLSDDLWMLLGPALENKLVDGDESVRRTAIAVVVDTALIAPRRVPNKVYANLSARCKDKAAKVRAYAIERLAELFLKTRLQWIPNAMFASLCIGHAADAALVEFAINDMLPKPVDASVAGTAAAANRKKQATLGATMQGAGKQPSYKFDFEMNGENEGDANANKKGGNSNSADDKKAIMVIEPTFLGAFVQLCSSFDDANWTLMLTLMHKKAQLRLTALRLIQIRHALKAKTNTEQNTELAIRLINFLTQKTNSDAWGSLFREADDTATRWLMQLCDDTCKNYYLQGEVQLDTKVKGRTHAELYKFLSNNILKRLCLPFAEKDVTELLAIIEKERKAKNGGDAKARLGALRALEAIVHMAPHLALSTATASVARWVKEDADAARRGQDPEVTKAMSTSLRILSDIATLCSSNNELPKEVLERKNDIIATLGKICLSSEDGAIAKRAALCLIALFKNQNNAFQQLMLKVQEKLSVIAAQGESAINATTVSLIRTFGAFATNAPDAIVVSAELIAEAVTTIMLTAVRAHRDEDDVDAIVAAKKNPNGHSLLTYPCLLAEVVDASAKALTRHALSLPGHSAAAAVPELFNTLWKAFRETQSLPTGSAGACKRRLALHKQFLKLLFKGESIFSAAGVASAAASATTTTTRRGKDGAATTAAVSQTTAGNLELMRKELSVVAMISSEDHDEVRHAVQAKLKDYCLKAIPAGHSDVRKVAMLCMTAIAEDGKAGYNALKGTLSEIADRLNLHKVQQKVTLADNAKAWRFFLEYAVPPLVIYMAHHTTYMIEKDDEENPFKHFQRPWQLLFDEMLRDTTESASALQEMFRKLRALDDGIPNPPEEVATRVICDLGCKVLLTILGEKSVSNSAPYPGALLTPWYFSKPADPNAYPQDMVFLPKDVQVTARPLFGLPVGLLAANGGAASMAAGHHHGKPSQSVARGASRSVAVKRGGDYDDEDTAEVEAPTANATPAVSPAKVTGAKRARAEEEATNDGPSPQPKASAKATKGGARTEPSPANSAAAASPKSPAKSPAKTTIKASATASLTDKAINAILKTFDMSAFADEARPTADLQRQMYRAVAAVIAKYPAEEAQYIKFGEIRVAVQETLGRKWTDAEKEFTKLCVVAQQTPQ